MPPLTPFEIYIKIIDLIRSSIATNAGEVNIVKNSVEQIEKVKQSFGPNVNIRTGFCHKNPYAFFKKPHKLFNKEKTELGDFLFVIKYLDNGDIIDNRALFFQAKYSNDSNDFKIELHQFHFYIQIENIKFNFGKTTYKKSAMKPIIWEKISKPKEFGDYILLGPRNVLDLYTSEIAFQYNHFKEGHFQYNLNQMHHGCIYFNSNHFLRCNYLSPLFNFILPFGRGNKIEGNFKIFIDLIYKKLGMIPDPPDENESFWEENEQNHINGFGLIEITIDNRKESDVMKAKS